MLFKLYKPIPCEKIVFAIQTKFTPGKLKDEKKTRLYSKMNEGLYPNYDEYGNLRKVRFYLVH